MTSIVYDKQHILLIFVENPFRKVLVDLDLGFSFPVYSLIRSFVVITIPKGGFQFVDLLILEQFVTYL
jgi:hypothetical protein